MTDRAKKTSAHRIAPGVILTALAFSVAGCGAPATVPPTPATAAGSPSASMQSAPGSPSPTPAGGLAGHWDGTYQGFHVAFDIAGGKVKNFHADGSWNCATGIAELVADVPGSFPLNAAGNGFTIDTQAQISGYNTTWQIVGTIDGTGGASGTFTEKSDVACSREGADWQAH